MHDSLVAERFMSGARAERERATDYKGEPMESRRADAALSQAIDYLDGTISEAVKLRDELKRTLGTLDKDEVDTARAHALDVYDSVALILNEIDEAHDALLDTYYGVRDE